MGNLAQKEEKFAVSGMVFSYSCIVNVQSSALNEISRDTYFVVCNQFYHST